MKRCMDCLQFFDDEDLIDTGDGYICSECNAGDWNEYVEWDEVEFEDVNNPELL